MTGPARRGAFASQKAAIRFAIDPRGFLDATIESFGGDEAGLETQIASLL